MSFTKKLSLCAAIGVLMLILMSTYIGYYQTVNDARDVINEAVAKNDPRICKRINDFFGSLTWSGHTRNDCYSVLASENGNIQACDFYLGGHNSFCISAAAVKTNNPTFCEKIPGERSKGNCYGRFVAMTGNVKSCDERNLIDPEAVELCRSAYLGYRDFTADDIGFCEKNFTARIDLRNDCYRIIASSSKDQNLCNLIVEDAYGITAEQQRQWCVHEVDITN